MAVQLELLSCVHRSDVHVSSHCGICALCRVAVMERKIYRCVFFFLRNMQYLYPCPRRSQPAWPAGCWANAVDLINEPKMPSDKPLRLPQDPSCCCKKMQQLQLWSRKTLPNGPLIPLIKYLKGVSSNMLHKFTFNHQFNRWEMSK